MSGSIPLFYGGGFPINKATFNFIISSSTDQKSAFNLLTFVPVEMSALVESGRLLCSSVENGYSLQTSINFAMIRGLNSDTCSYSSLDIRIYYYD